MFANSRRLAERLCTRLNELAWERRPGGDGPGEDVFGTDVPGAPVHWAEGFPGRPPRPPPRPR
nr:hypothetical protein GCM10020093_104440 [Planobispora longispora]